MNSNAVKSIIKRRKSIITWRNKRWQSSISEKDDGNHFDLTHLTQHCMYRAGEDNYWTDR